MSVLLERAAHDAAARGWHIRTIGESIAVLEHQGTPRLTTAFHLINIVASLLTCVWLLGYLILWAIHDSKSQPARTLLLREVGDKIEHEVVTHG